MKTTIFSGWRIAMLAFLSTIYGCTTSEPESFYATNITLQALNECDSIFYKKNYNFQDLKVLRFSRFNSFRQSFSTKKRTPENTIPKNKKAILIPNNTENTCSTIPFNSSESRYYNYPPTEATTSYTILPFDISPIRSNTQQNNRLKGIQFLSTNDLHNPNNLITSPGVSLSDMLQISIYFILIYSIILKK